MRVTGGRLRGQRIGVPRGDHVRPTQDMVREALFSILGGRVAGAHFLDLFAGSGSVGIGAWSLGAAPVVWVESDRRVLAVLRENVRRLCPREARICAGDVLSVLKRGMEEAPFDLIYCDPPYHRDPGGHEAPSGSGLLARVLALVAERSWLSRDGLMILEQGVEEPRVDAPGWAVVTERRYGRTSLRFLRSEGPVD